MFVMRSIMLSCMACLALGSETDCMVDTVDPSEMIVSMLQMGLHRTEAESNSTELTVIDSEGNLLVHNAQSQRALLSVRKDQIAKGEEWWLTLDADPSFAANQAQLMDNLFPVAWMHVPKCGESLFNAIIHIPGACPSVPEDFEVTTQSVGNPLTIAGFYNMFGPREFSCPGAISPLWNGNHRGIASDKEFEENFVGKSLIMIRQPEQRIISAYKDTTHSWPYPEVAIPETINDFADGIQGCITKMLTRGGESYFVDTSDFAITFGPHWGGACGDPPKPTAEESALAKERLQQFLFVGITDQWQMSMCLFHATMNTHCQASDFSDSRTQDNLAHPPYNVTEYLGDFLDPYDGSLFEYGLTLFDQRLTAHGLSPEACKPCFDEAGIVFNGS